MKTYIFGAGGHGKVVCDILEAAGQRVDGFIDDAKRGASHFGVPVLGEDQLECSAPVGVVVAVGANHVRARIAERLRARCPQAVFVNAIHPTAHVARSARLGVGNVVCAGAIIGPDGALGDHCVVNTGAQADHDCALGDFVSLAPGVILGGGVTISELTYVGLGARVIHGVKIGAHAVIGAGSTVVGDIDGGVVAYGSPCRAVRVRAMDDGYL